MNTMIRKLFFAAGLLFSGLFASAQQRMPNRVNTYSDEGAGGGFNKANLFMGGSLSLGFSSYNFNIGGSPELGYTLTNWLDAGVLVNLNYNSERADPSGYYNPDTRYRSFNYGAGLFARAYPLPFLFFQAQPEYNFIDYNEKNMQSGMTWSAHTQAPSFLLGVGYGQRVVGQGSFYISLMFDAISNVNSPYRDQNGAALPVIKAGFDIYLHRR